MEHAEEGGEGGEEVLPLRGVVHAHLCTRQGVPLYYVDSNKLLVGSPTVLASTTSVECRGLR